MCFSGHGDGELNSDTDLALRFIECRLDDETYALSMDFVQGLKRSDSVRWTQSASGEKDWVKTDRFIPVEPRGWLMVNGRDLPVYALADLLHGGSTRSQMTHQLTARGVQQRVVVLEHEFKSHKGVSWKSWGLLVDGVSQVRRSENADIYSMGSLGLPRTHDGLAGIIRDGTSMIVALSPPGLYAVACGLPADEGVKSPVWRMPLESAPSASRAAQALNDRGKTKPNMPELDQHARLITFSLPGTELSEPQVKFGLSLTQVPEILRQRAVIPLPGSPDYVLGLILWRQRPILLVDLAARLGLGSAAQNGNLDTSRIIIVRDYLKRAAADPQLPSVKQVPAAGCQEEERGCMVGMLIEPGVKVLGFPIEYRRHKGSIMLEDEHIRGAVDIRDETLVIPDVGALIQW